jgi:hypothetical protein
MVQFGVATAESVAIETLESRQRRRARIASRVADWRDDRGNQAGGINRGPASWGSHRVGPRCAGTPCRVHYDQGLPAQLPKLPSGEEREPDRHPDFQLGAILKLVPVSRLLMGLDFPLMPKSTFAPAIADVGRYPAFSENDLRNISNANAFRLYLELAKRVGWGTERRLSAV